MADEDRDNLHREEKAGDFVEKRGADRFRVPPVYQRYINMRVRSGGDFLPVSLGDFSRSGILFVSPVSFSVDSHAECIISIPDILSRDISIGIQVKHCYSKDGSFLVGGEINTIADTVWFDVFAEIHDFIVQREGFIY